MEETITTTKKTYEGMFLLNEGQGNSEAACEPIHAVLDRSGAELLSSRLWDERKLAYEIKGCKRGTYVLTYFKMDPNKVVELEHDCMLNESILRVLFLRKENLKDEEMNVQTPAMIDAASREHEATPRAEEDKTTAGEKSVAEKAPVAETPPVAEKAPVEETPAVEEEKIAETPAETTVEESAKPAAE